MTTSDHDCWRAPCQFTGWHSPRAGEASMPFWVGYTRLHTLFREHHIMLGEILAEYDAQDATEGER